MKFEKSHTLKEIAEFLGIEFEGNPELPITGINEIHRVENGDLVFADHPKYIKKALESPASVLLINQSVSLPNNKAALISKNPFGDFKKLAEHFNKPTFWEEGKYKTGEGTLIHPSAVIASTVSIGKNCLIHPNVTIYENCIIGDHVEIHANTVIGGNAFYYQKKTDTYNRMYTCGRVIIEDDVEIGTLCSIDRGVTSDTIIGKGTKIDNQVHIGHDSILGQNCLLAAHVGVAGCVELGNNVTLWGQVGVKSDVRIGNNVVVMAQSGVHKDLEDNGIYFGSPIGSAKTKYREIAALKKLPEILENL